MEPAMSRDSDYVRKWLAQIQDKNVVGQEDLGRGQSYSVPKNRADAPPSKPAHHPPHHRELNAIDTTRLRPKAKRRREPSSDSSLLKPVDKPKPPSLPKQYRRDDVVGQSVSTSDHSRKRQKIQSSDIELSVGSSVHRTTQPKTFEKRRRHKTREDRYEPRGKARGPSKNSTDRVETSKKQKRGPRGKGANKAGENLMRSFASKSISQDRLTLQLSSGLGIFKNGRASSPNRRRGLPDLAFSEMEFLQRSRNNPSKDNEKAASKYRGKQQRKALREQEEISTFFKPSKTPLKERSINSKDRRVKNGVEDTYSLYSKPTVTDGYSSGRMNSAGLSVNLQDQPSRQHKESHPTCDITYSGRQQNPALDHSENHPRNTSAYSEHGTTWSEMQYTPTQTTSDHGMESNSPTPDFVRTCIKNTGVFKDTGISPHSGLRQPRPNRKDTSHGRHYFSNVTDERNEGFIGSKYASTTESSVDESQHLSPRRHSNGILNDDYSEQTPMRRPTESRVLINTNDDQISTTEGAGSGVTVDIYDKEKGRAQHHRNTKEPKSTLPFSRREISKRARIQRPVTVLPVKSSEAQQSWRRRDNLAGAHSSIQSRLTTNASDSHSSPFQLGPASDFLEAQNMSNKEAYEDNRDDENRQNWDPISAEQNILDANQGQDETISPAITVVKPNPQSILKPESFGTSHGEPSSGNWTSSVRATATSAYGLPLRGSSGVGSRQQSTQHKRWSPSFDVAIEPLYAHQMQAPHGKGQKQVHFAAELSSEPFQGDFHTLNQSNTQYDDVIDDELFDDTHLVESTELEGFYQEKPWDDNAIRSRHLNVMIPETTHLLRSEEGFAYRPDSENNEAWNENEQNSYRHATSYGLHRQEFDEAYSMAGTTSLQYDDQGDDNQGSIRGFWQPRRQY